MGTHGYISIDGNIFSLGEAKISALDRGWLFGDRLIETMVAYQSKVWNFSMHMQRLRSSAAECGFCVPWSDKRLRGECETLLKCLEAKTSFVRLMITRGDGFGLVHRDHFVPHVYIYALEAPKIMEEVYTEGIRLVLKEALPATTTGHKTGCYHPAISSLRALGEGEDILWWQEILSEQKEQASVEKCVLESSSAHVFFVSYPNTKNTKNAKPQVITPLTSELGMFAGISSAEVKALLLAHGVEVCERMVLLKELPKMNECFLCSSVRGPVPVSQIDDMSFGSTGEDSLYWQLYRMFYSKRPHMPFVPPSRTASLTH